MRGVLRQLGLLIGGAALAAAALPATLSRLEVTRERGRYELIAETYLEAKPRDIFDVLLEYDDNQFQRISSVYKESAYLEPADDGTPMIYTRMEGCVVFFCKSMRRVERLIAEEPSLIQTYTVPEQSDFRYSFSEWTLEPQGDGTWMKYVMVMEPDFWVPPIVGPWFLKRTLAVGGERAIIRIERIAQGVPMPRRVAASDD